MCRLFVGILNKTSGQMEDAELFNMQLLFSNESFESESALESDQNFRKKMDSFTEPTSGL